MNSERDRIALAEAMGWVHVEQPQGPVQGKFWAKHPDQIRIEPPDPFTDANDDYAVLEWMRNQDKYNFMFVFSAWNYQIGDYARAACKALEVDEIDA